MGKREGFRRMLLGEEMPDKNDPKYKERYEQDVENGRRFARVTRIDRAAASVQGFANAHRKLFLAMVFGFVGLSFGWNMYRIAVVYEHKPSQHTATEMQDSVLRQRHKTVPHKNVELQKQYKQ